MRTPKYTLKSNENGHSEAKLRTFEVTKINVQTHTAITKFSCNAQTYPFLESNHKFLLAYLP